MSEPEKKQKKRVRRSTKISSKPLNPYLLEIQPIIDYFSTNNDDMNVDDLVALRSMWRKIDGKLEYDLQTRVIQNYFRSTDDAIIEQYNDIMAKKNKENLIHETDTSEGYVDIEEDEKKN